MGAASEDGPALHPKFKGAETWKRQRSRGEQLDLTTAISLRGEGCQPVAEDISYRRLSRTGKAEKKSEKKGW